MAEIVIDSLGLAIAGVFLSVMALGIVLTVADGFGFGELKKRLKNPSGA